MAALAASAGLALGQATTNESARATDGRPAPAAERFAGTDHLDTWWQDATFYHIFVRSFADSTEGPLANDGVGDIRGMIERLDYLNDGDPSTTTDLGVTGIWLMPIMQSPSSHGYAPVDYRLIDDEYGTNKDFQDFIAECEKRGIRVILDLVLNHSSSDHKWFQASLDPESEYRDFYVWLDEDPGWGGPWGQDVWHEADMKGGASDGSVFYGLFWHGMPDLNYRTQAVTEAVFDLSRFWLEDMGAHGFRLDAIRHLVEDGPVQENTPETHAWLRAYQSFLRSVDAEVLTVGEVWADSDAVSRYVGDQMDIAFEFDLGYRLVDAVREGRAEPMVTQLKRMDELYPLGMYATFLRNHDQTRVLTEFNGDRDSAALAATIQFALPGVPFIYYGEEIGMAANKPDPELRTPMQWTSDVRTAGFTTAEPWKAPKADTATVNVEVQQGDAGSMLNLYQRLIRVRNETPALRTGALELVETGHDGVLAFTRELDGSRYLCLFNLTPFAIDGRMLRTNRGFTPARELLHDAPLTRRSDGPIRTLEPKTGYVIELTN